MRLASNTVDNSALPDRLASSRSWLGARQRNICETVTKGIGRAVIKVGMKKVRYHLHFITAAGTQADVATPSDSLEDAMNVACPALRYGATDAWVVDDDGKKWADFEAIKKHCAGLKASN